MKFTVEIHDKFIQHVENHRKTSLKVTKDDRRSTIYNADVFMGEKAKEFG